MKKKGMIFLPLKVESNLENKEVGTEWKRPLLNKQLTFQECLAFSLSVFTGFSFH